MPDHAEPQGRLPAYLDIGRAGLAAIVRHLGGDPGGATTLAQLFERLDARRMEAGSWDPLAQALGLDAQEMEDFTKAARRAVRVEAGPPAASDEVAALRWLNWLERVQEKQPAAGIAVQLPPPGERALRTGQQQVRALELILRGVIGETHGDQQRLLARLRELSGDAAVERWLAVADPGDVLSGTMFSDLGRIFAHKREYPQHYAALFAETPFLSLLKDKRGTLAAFLEDVRDIRNRLAHHKRVTPVQIALLGHYYHEVVKPLQDAHDDGVLGVNPDGYFDASKEELERHFQRVADNFARLGEDVQAVRDDVAALDGKVEEVRKTVERTGEDVRTVRADTSWLRRHQRWIGLGVLALGAASLFTLRSTESMRGSVTSIDRKMDTVKKEVSADPRKELANNGVAWKESEFIGAISRGDTRNVALFLAGGMRWQLGYTGKVLEQGDSKTVALLMEHPELLAREDSDCAQAMGRARRWVPGSSPLQAQQLSGDEQRMLQRFCSRPQDIAYATKQYESELKSHREARAEYDRQKAAVKPVPQCEAAEMNREGALINEAGGFNPMRRGTSTPRDELLGEVYVGISTGLLDRNKLRAAVHKYCTDLVEKEPNIDINDWSVRANEQILKAVKS
ncbi:STY4199 family HEPN domain-containing protein [Pseudoduganella aquatica]|uniref:STY4199-like HEPN domain-containing protein n=1 Tax=Pseudoduganella aquatica TaxID=2660641 RepID=A0A7X4HFD8_9BURK|nr:STY4199 family HEPN domain-containing protein [Pseudoduganella aquatica]MYN10201.1 hypothetical protein [Pseudoduganella aquatica]